MGKTSSRFMWTGVALISALWIGCSDSETEATTTGPGSGGAGATSGQGGSGASATGGGGSSAGGAGACVDFGLTDDTAWVQFSNMHDDQTSSLPQGARAHRGWFTVDGCAIAAIAENDGLITAHKAVPPAVFTQLGTNNTVDARQGLVFFRKVQDSYVWLQQDSSNVSGVLYRVPADGSGDIEMVTDEAVWGVAFFDDAAYISIGEATTRVLAKVGLDDIASGTLDTSESVGTPVGGTYDVTRFGDQIVVQTGTTELADRTCVDAQLTAGAADISTCLTASPLLAPSSTSDDMMVKYSQTNVEILLAGQTTVINVPIDGEQRLHSAYGSGDTAIVAYGDMAEENGKVTIITGVTATPVATELAGVIPGGAFISDVWTDGSIALIMTAKTQNSSRVTMAGRKL